MAKGVLQAWSTTAADNGTGDELLNWAEGAAFKMPDINNSARGMMAALKSWANQFSGGATYGGSANAYTITSDSPGAISAYEAGMMFMLKANHTNAGNVTLNVDGVGAKSVRDAAGAELAAGTIVSGGHYLIVRDQANDRFMLVGGVNADAFQPLDATLTALAALSWSSGEVMLTMTAADTFALRAITAFGRSLIDDVDAAAARSTLELVIGSDVQAYDANTAKLNVAQTWSANRQTRSQGARSTYDLYTGANPGMHCFENDQSTDEGWWTLFSVNNKTMALFATRTDSDGAGVNPIRILRGTGTAVAEVEINGDYFEVNAPMRAKPVRYTGVSGTLTSTHANAVIELSGNFTVPANVFAAGDCIRWYAGSSARTITQGSGGTQRLSGTSTTGDLSAAARGTGLIEFLSATEWVVSGDVS